MTIPQKTRLESEDVLRILQALKNNPEMTQRDLAQLVGISLGKANFILKALIQKGLVKAHNFKNSNNKKAYLYMLTPSGIEEKARITYEFLIIKLQQYERLEAQIRLLKEEIAENTAADAERVSGQQG
jgi:EPS-associated MarR family transcriptional regulator